MKRLADLPTEQEEPEAPYSIVRRSPTPLLPPLLGPDPSDLEDRDDFGKALAHLEDCQEVLIWLQTEEVKRLVPIPVWNLIVRTEKRVTSFLDLHTDYEDDGKDNS